VTPVTTAPAGDVTGDVSGDGLAASVAAFVAGFRFAVTDRRNVLAAIAIRLARAFDETGSVPALRELRSIMGELSEPRLPAGVDELEMRREARRVDQLLAAAERRAVERGAGL
jgi:hypothetical protein